jgi:uncharacterized zinc-type alcohol dehydrogenase-like protein
MQNVHALAAEAPNAAFKGTVIARRDLRPHDVLVAISYVGICHSDIHTARGEWGDALFPLVPGHEITGVVSAVGAEVTRFRAGDRVGVGVIVDSCRVCPNCMAGQEQHCQSGATDTYNSIDRTGEVTYGGYSTHIVVDEEFVLHIPDHLDLARAAPLLCAGITLYSPLKKFDTGKGTRVGIVGLGGLGHVGVKIAHALGAEVTVLSRSARKRADALRLGADHYVAVDDAEHLAALSGSLDLIINTVSAPLEADGLLSLLGLNGRLVVVGLPDLLPIRALPASLFRNGRGIAASKIGGISETQEMLEFCAAHDIGAVIEVISALDVNDAFDRVVAGAVRYRFVIDASTITADG